MVEVKEQASSEEKDIDESEALQTSNQSSNKE